MKRPSGRTVAFTLVWLLAGFFVFAAPGRSDPQAPEARLPKTLAVPERGFVSSEPGETWEQGLLSGNGTIGALSLIHI